MTTSALPRRRRALAAIPAAIIAGLLLATLAPTASAAITTNEARIIGWINADRADAGLRPLRGWGKLHAVADLRAGRMASAGRLSHSVGGDLGRQLRARNIKSWMWGEDIAVTSYPKGLEAAKSLFRAWKGSPSHWALIMSKRFNYVGIGLAYRSSSRQTYASLVFSESPDHSGARSAVTSGQLKGGNDIAWSWRGWDLPLQTHTAGFANFDVQYRVGWSAWKTIRTRSTSTSWTAWNRAKGQSYAIRVRGRDRAGNVGPWSSESRIRVP